ncbi:MAG: hypothetical protein OXH57_05595 [Ekhidna sp.]|nr:hypothetical protein [Ekhidna sp.]
MSEERKPKTLSLLHLMALYPIKESTIKCIDTQDRLNSLFGNMTGKSITCKELVK